MSEPPADLLVKTNVDGFEVRLSPLPVGARTWIDENSEATALLVGSHLALVAMLFGMGESIAFVDLFIVVPTALVAGALPGLPIHLLIRHRHRLAALISGGPRALRESSVLSVDGRGVSIDGRRIEARDIAWVEATDDSVRIHGKGHFTDVPCLGNTAAARTWLAEAIIERCRLAVAEEGLPDVPDEVRALRQSAAKKDRNSS